MINKIDKEPPIRFYGRRKGRPLRSKRAELMKTLMPKIEIKLSDDDINPYDFFENTKKCLWMEIGFGGGEHLAKQALSNPDIGIIGCEPFIDGVASLVRYVDEEKLNNVRIFPDDARLLIDKMPDACLDRCFVLYADPWPKKKHIERRFIGKENLDRLSRIMKSNALLHLATDVSGLAQWMREQCNEHKSFDCVYDGFDAPDDWVPTRYEKKGIVAGRKPEYLIYKRK